MMAGAVTNAASGPLRHVCGLPCQRVCCPRQVNDNRGFAGEEGVAVTGRQRVQAVYFDRAYHNETTARLWWDDHKSFFDTREQLMQHLLVSGRRTLQKFASKVRLSGHRLPSIPGTGAAARRRFKSPPPAEYAATSAMAADDPDAPGLDGPPAGGLYQPADVGGEGAQGQDHANRVFENAMAYVAQQGGAGGNEVHADNPDDGGGVYRPPTLPLV